MQAVHPEQGFGDTGVLSLSRAVATGSHGAVCCKRVVKVHAIRCSIGGLLLDDASRTTPNF